MRTRELARLIGTLGKLPRDQRKTVAAELSAMESCASSTDVIETGMPTRPDCPHCASRQIVKHGRCGGLQRFRCRHCNRTFNALTGTPLAMDLEPRQFDALAQRRALEAQRLAPFEVQRPVIG